jgi:hypothetical protein
LDGYFISVRLHANLFRASQLLYRAIRCRASR